jgi:hypothetical protein
MILNTQIWQATIQAAKAKAAHSPAWLRAIDRAAVEIDRAKYWSFADGVLTIVSTTSGTRYTISDEHDCPARGQVCKHRAARQLMVRYTERLASAASAPAEIVATALPQPTDERAQLITDIKAAWHRARPFASLSGAVHQVFGVACLEDVSTDNLRRVLAALTRPQRQPAPAAQLKPQPKSMEVNYDKRIPRLDQSPELTRIASRRGRRSGRLSFRAFGVSLTQSHRAF